MGSTPPGTAGVTDTVHGTQGTGGAAIPSGTLLGRYVVLRPLGSGGAGAVYQAFDPELGRDVAIKVLHDEARESESVGSGRARLLREAQAMAKVRHANVVPVYDVGTFEGRVFIAMELVLGGTLRDWLRTPRAHKDVMRVFVAAGRGLAGAHAAGLVHRDFKPDNVLIGVASSGEERVLVMDFGLVQPVVRADGAGEGEAIATGEASSAPASDGALEARRAQVRAMTGAAGTASAGTPTVPGEIVSTHDLAASLAPVPSNAASGTVRTETGALLGTPGYMAPEQILLEPTDARTDQFAFAVSLYEALCGARPFPGKTIADRLESTLRGQICEGTRRAPKRVARVLERGLSIDPAARWPSMDALLAALTRDPMARAQPWLLGAAVMVASVTVAGFVTKASASRLERCEAARTHLGGVWDEATKARVAAAFQGSKLPFAADSWGAVEKKLDAYADAWAGMHKDACLAGLRGEQVPAVQTLRMSCLDDRLTGLRAATEILARADPATVTKALDLTGGLRRIETCADVAALSAPVPLPEDPAERTRVQSLRARVESLRTELLTGKPTTLDAATALAADARATKHAPLVADALFLQGLAQQMAGRFKEAEVTLEEAAVTSDAARADHTRAEAFVRLAFVTGNGLARRADGLRWARLADAAVGRVNDRSLEADAAFAVAVIYLESGDRAKTFEQATRAFQISEEVRGDDSPLTVKALNVLGAACDSVQDYPASERAYLRAIATYERILGPRHPYIAAPLGNLGLLYTRLGRYEEAVALMRRSNEIDRDAFGPDHADVAVGSATLAAALREMGRLDESLAEAEASIAIYERRFGPEHLDLYLPLLEKGRTLLAKGDAAGAIAPLERALLRATPGEVDPLYVAETKLALGRALMRAGRDQGRGRKLVEQARAELAASDPPVPARVAEAEGCWREGLSARQCEAATSFRSSSTCCQRQCRQ